MSDINFSNIYEAKNDVAKRSLSSNWTKFAMLLSVVLAVFHLYIAIIPSVSEFMRNAIHFAGFSILCSLTYPVFRPKLDAPNRTREPKIVLIMNLLFGLIVAAASIYLVFAEDAIYDRGVKLSLLDWIAGLVVVFGAIELTRRATGWIIPVLIIIALSYVTWLGPLIGGIFTFSGLSYETVMFRSIYGDDAIFGAIARISSTYVFLFIIFGAFLLRSGAGDFVIQISQAIAGKFIGGPGFVAVIASGLTGTISGSAVANTASTGVITIPLMQRVGFPSKFAAAVEASSSTGGQLMPPIMGAGAFVMASYTRIPYESIVAVAALPALLYFLSVAMFVRIEAKKQNLTMNSKIETSVWTAIKDNGASFIIPIALLIGLLVAGFTPTYAAVIGIISVVASSWLTKNPMGIKAIYEALALGSKNMIMTAILLCAVGLIINVIATAGIGNTFSLMISNWANGNVFIAIILIGLASLVLGMGLPVTAAYIVLATLSAPALASMIANSHVVDMLVAGNIPEMAKINFMLIDPDIMSALAEPMSKTEALNLLNSMPEEILAVVRDQAVSAELITTALLSAHMIVFWLSQDSNVTPPVCLASFTAAAIAKSPPMATGFASWKIAKGLYIVPLLFAYTPFLSGDFLDALRIFFFASFGIYAIAASLEGYMEEPLNIAMRILAFLLGVACLWPNPLINLLASISVMLFLIINIKGSKLKPSKARFG